MQEKSKRDRKHEIVRNLTLIFLTIVFWGDILPKEKNSIPDFAFPEKVAVKSDSLLKASLLEGNDLQAFRAMMDICLANSLRDNRSLQENLSLIDSVSSELRSPYHSLCYLLKADMLADVYDSERWIYDNRNLPLEEPYPADPSEWSGKMYMTEIFKAVGDACNSVEALPDIPLKAIDILITSDENPLVKKLDVTDFLVLKAVNILRRYSSNVIIEIIPFFPDKKIETVSLAVSYSDKADELLSFLTRRDSESGDSYGLALAVCRKAEMMPAQERLQYLNQKADELIDSEACGLILDEIWQTAGQSSEGYDTSLYKNMSVWVKKFPDAIGADRINSELLRMSEKRMEVEIPNYSLPETPINGKVRVYNMPRGYVLIYKLSPNQFNAYDGLIMSEFPGGKDPVRILEVPTEGEIPFQVSREIVIPGLSPGLYVAVPSETGKLAAGWGKKNKNMSFPTFRVSEISLLTGFDTNIKDSGRLYVVDAKTQAPVKGASVTYYKGSDKKISGSANTGDDGSISIPEGYYRYEAFFGSSMARGESGFNFYPERENDNERASILTDLSVYRPGDTVSFAVIGWRELKNEKFLIKNKEIKVVARDANYTPFDTVTIRLDNLGRGDGRTVIPDGKLLGRYHLSAVFPDNYGKSAGTTDFEVAEYKLPGFLVTLEKEDQKNFREGDDVIFKGFAKTYAGLPIAASKVNFTVNYEPLWGRFGKGGAATYSSSVTTNRDGEFIIVLPTKNLKGTRFDHGRFTITADVTSPSGETQKSPSLHFSLGKELMLRPRIDSGYEIKGDSVSLHVPVYDILDIPVKTEVEYNMMNLPDSTIILAGSFESPSLNLPADKIASGKYSLMFRIPGQDEWNSSESVFYRADDIKTPFETALWVPETNYIYPENDDEIEVKFGSRWQGSEILAIITDGNNIIKREWVESDGRMVSYKIDLPDKTETYFVTLSGMHDFKREISTITIVPKKSIEKLKINTESFRPDLRAGNEEKWIFSFNIGDLPVPDVTAFAVMSDKALNAIHDFRWNLNFPSGNIYCKTRIGGLYLGNSYSYRGFSPLNRSYINIPSLPGWQTYNYPLAGPGGSYINGPVFYRMAKSTRAGGINDAMVTMKEEKYMAMNEMADAEEATVEMEMQADSVESSLSETVEGEPAKAESDGFRPVEMPLVFFKTDLTGDSEGRVAVEFEVPDFNTTWQFQIAGYTPELKSAVLTLDAVASKPVIVKSNMPQYLRTSDHAAISAMMFNNSPDTCDISGRIVVIDAFSGKELAQFETEARRLGPSESSEFSLNFTVPDNVSQLSVKAIASDGSHTDGERGYVPVLPSSTPVIESTVFYLSSTSGKIEMKIPSYPKLSNVTLKYCDNPLWEVLLSLPGITNDNSGNALAISDAIYGNLTASEIAGRTPEIKKDLAAILSDPDLTVSNLMKDENLKSVTLQMTPWVNDAASATERIRSISTLFDGDMLKQMVDNGITGLSKLQQPDGGFSWFEGMRSSGYITLRVLQTLAPLYKRGTMPEELKEIARKAVKYYDRELVENRKKWKELPVVSVMEYLYVRSFYGFPMPSGMISLEKECIKGIKESWRHWDIPGKAKSAVVLWRYKEDRKIVNEILESLLEFAIKDPVKGWYFMTGSHRQDIMSALNETSLAMSAFMEIDPSSEAVEGFCQWLLLQKETQEWGAKSSTLTIIQSLMELAPKDFSNRGVPKISIGGKEIRLPESGLATGNFTIQLSSVQTGKSLCIEKEPGLPGWGGVIAQYISPIKDVKVEKSENIAIEKAVYVIENGIARQLKEKDTMNVGDKIKVILNVSCEKDMEYVVITDSRSACLQPVDQISGLNMTDGVVAYREIRADKTSFFMEQLPVGKYVFSYECTVDREGEYSLGIAGIQSQYSPSQTAHSAGKVIKVVNRD